MKSSLPDIAIRRPVTVAMLVVTLLGLGVIAYQRVTIEFMPPMEFPYLGVYIPYPGATPAQVEQEIAIPAEGEFRTLPNLSEIRSNSDSDGCWMGFNFDWGADMDTALADVRDRVERLRLVLPEDVDRMMIRRWRSDAMPVMEIGLTAPTDDKDAFAHIIDTIVQPRILRLDGVADVQIWGHDRGSIMIDIDQHAMLSRNVSMFDLISTLNTADVDMGIGEIEDGSQKYLLRAESRVQSIPEYARIPVGQSGARLSELASGSIRSQEREWERTLDGKRQMFIIVTKESEANTVATCNALERELDAIMALPEMAGAKKIVFFNQGEMIISAIGNLKMAGLFGGLLALCVLFIFLGRLRPTLLIAAIIPSSLVAAFVVMYFTGITLNMVTMMSLIIALGMVMDNAIVVIENIYRYKGLGHEPFDASRRGANEVALAITAATVTTIVVFIPVFYMGEGQMAIFMKPFAVTIAVSLIASLLLALTVIPMVTSRFKKADRTVAAVVAGVAGPRMPEPIRTTLGRLAAPLRILHPGRWFAPAYLSALRFGIQWRLVSVLVLAGIIWITVEIPMKQVGVQAEPTEDRREVDIRVRLDPNYDMAMAREVFDVLQSAIEPRREELGIKHIFRSHSARGGELEVQLNGPDDNLPMPYTTEEVMNILWWSLGTEIPGGTLRYSAGESRIGGGGGGGGGPSVSLRLSGDDMETLNEYADRLILVMNAVPELSEAEKSEERADQEIQVNIDNILANHAGISPSRIAQTVGFALRGTRLSQNIVNGREIEVWAQYQEADRASEANLKNVMLMGDTGSMVTVDRLVDLSKAETPRRISRWNGKSSIWVSAKSSKSDLTAVQAQLDEIIKDFELPTGYALDMGDEIRMMEENIDSFFASLILAVILIYIVMAALFESLLLPLSILTSIPLSAVGVYWFMHLTGTSLDTIAFIGCILMVGVVVNNGIVIVDYINQLRKKGLERFDAIMQAGRDRLRPVLMTAITTILGALPLAVGGAWGEEAVVGLGRSMIGGLTAGTFLTLFIVPLFYSLIDDLQSWLGRYIRNIAQLRRPTTA